MQSSNGLNKFFRILLLLFGCFVSFTQSDIDFNTINDDGSYAFRHTNDDIGGYYHSASASPDNIVRGRYGSRNPSTGQVEEVVYTAGPRGFRANGPRIHRKMDLAQYPPRRIGSPDDPLADPFDDPSYSFSYRAPDSSRSESSDSTGRVRGLYSYLDDVGERHSVRYAAGAGTGFEVINAVPDNPISVRYSSPLYKSHPKARGKMTVQRGPNGSYKLIAAGPDHRRAESRGQDGLVRGTYSYLDDKGVQRTVEYVAGAGIGYRIVQNSVGPGTHVNPSVSDFRLSDTDFKLANEYGRGAGGGVATGGTDNSGSSVSGSAVSSNRRVSGSSNPGSINDDGSNQSNAGESNRSGGIDRGQDTISGGGNSDTRNGLRGVNNRGKSDRKGPIYSGTGNDNKQGSRGSQGNRSPGNQNTASGDERSRGRTRYQDRRPYGMGGTIEGGSGSSGGNRGGGDSNSGSGSGSSYGSSTFSRPSSSSSSSSSSNSGAGYNYDPPGSSDNYNFNDDDVGSLPPLITANRKILEIDRERDWVERHRDSTLIKNVGKWYIGLPPGQSVRAHVQNIDLVPLGGRRVPSPSEALRQDEIAEMVASLENSSSYGS